ncbi:hypothetical protein BCV69DRAFT_281889, partial [Microstroma glucosiphilum]
MSLTRLGALSFASASRSVFVRLPRTYPRTILHTLAVISHVAREAAEMQRPSSHSVEVAPPPLRIEQADFARDPWQRALLNYGFIQFASPTQAQAALNLPYKKHEVPLPPISPTSSSFIASAFATAKRPEGPLEKVLRKSAPDDSLRQEEEREIEYAGLRDVAPYLGLELPPFMLENVSEGTPADVLPSQFAQIEIKRRERGNASSKEGWRDRSGASRRHKEAFKSWQGFSQIRRGAKDQSDKGESDRV